MNAKEIGRRAGRIFQKSLPNNWIFRSQEDQEDYGVDGEIELANAADNATGFIFKVQVKGQESVSFINRGRTVSFQLNVEKLRYYMNMIEVALVLVVVDVTTERIFWKSLQDDHALRQSLKTALANNQETLAIHIPIENSLPETVSLLLSAVDFNMNSLRSNALSRMTLPIDNIIRKSPDDLLEEMLSQTKYVNFHLFSEVFERLYHSNELDKLFSRAAKVLASTTEEAETRFCAGIYIERVYQQKLDTKSNEYTQLCFNLYAQLLSIAKSSRASGHLKLYSIFLLRSIKTELAVNADYHYHLSEKAVVGDDFTRLILDLSRSKIEIRAAINVEKTINLVNRIITSGNTPLLLEVIPRIGAKVSIFAYRLQQDGLSEQSDYLKRWIKLCVRLSLSAAKKQKLDASIAEIIVFNATSGASLDEAKANLDESFGFLELIESKDVREKAHEVLSKIKLRIYESPADPTPDEELSFFRERAKALGINYEDPQDQIGRIISQGLKDYNPERVIKECENLLVFPFSSLGVPARMMGLPSAGMKWIYCKKIGHAMMGWSLDDIYISPIADQGFKGQFCDGCEHKNARDATWRWSSKWQEQEMEIHSEVISKMNSF